MKLKKIASLALAGLMAVSMLAGCGDNSSNSNGNKEPATGSNVSIVDAFNNDQNFTASNKSGVDEDLKITFTYSSTLESQLKSALSSESEDVDAAAVLETIKKLAGMPAVADTFYNNAGKADSVDVKDKATVTNIYSEKFVSSDYQNEKMFWNAITSDLKTTVDSLALAVTTKASNTAAGVDYFDYTYTGDVAMVSVEKANGVVNYYVVYTITQTAAKTSIDV